MFAEGSTKPLRLGIGKFGLGWLSAMAVLFAIFAWGLYAYSIQLRNGLIVTGLRSIGVGGSTWGLYVSFDVFFVGVSFAGISISAVIRLFGITFLKPIARMAELLTIIILTMGGCCIMADLGRPLQGLLNFPQYARVMSPFFGTFTLVVAGYLFASFVFFFLSARPDAAYLAERAKFPPLRWFYQIWAFGFKGTPDDYNRHANSSFWLSIFILPLLVTAHSTLGFIFGIQSSRPGWYSALMAPGFVVMAGISGTGFILIIAALVRYFLKLQEVITDKAFKWLGLLLMILSIIYLYFMAVEELTAHYAAPLKEMEVAHQITSGAYAPLFWITVGGLVLAVGLIFIQYLQGRTNILLHVAAGLLVNVSAVLKRLIIVVPSQTHGMHLPYREGFYFPSWVELSVILGLVALAAIIYMFFLKIFPIVPLHTIDHHEEGLGQVDLLESRRSHVRRLVLFAITLLIGIFLVTVGFLGSARYGTKVYLDPVIPFSPLIFIAGVMTCFISSIIYEIVPEWKKPSGA